MADEFDKDLRRAMIILDTIPPRLEKFRVRFLLFGWENGLYYFISEFFGFQTFVDTVAHEDDSAPPECDEEGLPLDLEVFRMEEVETKAKWRKNKIK